MVSTSPFISKSSSPFTSHCRLFQVHYLHLVSSSSSYSKVFFGSLARSNFLSLFSLSFIFTQWSVRTAKSTLLLVLFFFFLMCVTLVGWSRLGHPLVSGNIREICTSHSPGRIQFLSGGIRDSRKAGSLWGMVRGVGGVNKSIHQSWLAKWLGLRCWGFKGVQKEIPKEEASTLQIGLVAFPPGQCTSLQLHPCHRLFDQDGHQHSSSPSL